MASQRIIAVKDAATRLFLQQGYSRTQISHIAKEVGVSVGTIYHDFTGKQEIMHFVLKCTVDPDFINRDFKRPITDDLFDGLNQEIRAAFEKSGEDFSAPLKKNAEGYSFEALVSDTFDLLSKYAVGCLFIEKNQFDFKSLAESYKQYRQHFFEAMIGYVTLFISKGILRPLNHVELSTRLMIETLAWWAMDARYLSFDEQAKSIPPELAKEVCMDHIIAAYKL